MGSFVISLEKGEEDEFQGRASIRELEEKSLSSAFRVKYK